MDKLKTKILLISLLLLLLFSVQSVAAVSDNDGNLTSESIDLSICDNEDYISPDDVLSASDNLDELGADEISFTVLADEISRGGNVELQHDYYICSDSESTITIIGDNRIIDGRGAVIDMAGTTIQAFYVEDSGVTIKNLTIKNANFNGNGGAIYFYSSGTVENCNFVNNTATENGGAVFFNKRGNVANCNFTDNTAGYAGGAVFFQDNNCEVTNCNFADNTAEISGGAIYMVLGSVENCSFTNNSGEFYGGAIYMRFSSVENCNFTNNSAVYGGAINMEWGSFENCNFTGNNASAGSAIFFWDTSATKTVSNSIFLNNRANAETLEVTKNENNITITFTGNNNLLNAIYSRNDGEVTFTNVTYWSANGINSTGNFPIKPPRSNRQAGQNITLEIFDSDDKLVENVTLVTDINGQAIYDLAKLGNEKYRYNVYHFEDSYYTYAESNGTFTNSLGDFNLLQRDINGAAENSVLTLNRSYTFTVGMDENLADGIVIDKRITINGNGYTINALNKARIFKVTAGIVVLNNITFTNANASGDGGAVYFYGNGIVTNCNFIDNSAQRGGAFYLIGNVIVTNCNFVNNSASVDSSAINIGFGTVTNCNFVNNSAFGDFGAIWIFSGNVTNCNFVNNSARYGGAVYFRDYGTVTNCNFTNNTATQDGGAVYFNGFYHRGSTVTNCSFISNNAKSNGGAIRMLSGSVANSNFTNNTATQDGGAVYFESHFRLSSTVTNCNFTGNNATTGSAIYFGNNLETKTVSNSIFLNNRANAETLEVTKNENNITITFTGNNNLLNAIYSRNDGEVTFTNVTYWSANGINSTGNFPIKPPRSNRQAGQNITLEIFDSDDKLVENVTLVTDINGQAIYDLAKLSIGKFRYNVYHFEDSYYTYAESNGTFTNGQGDFNLLQKYINVAAINSELTLYRNYTFTVGLDENLTDGIVIGKPITINGNGYTINALNKARIFKVTADNVVLNNITFANANSSRSNGGAVYFKEKGNVTNCNFINNTATEYGGAIYFHDFGTVENCNFTNNIAIVVAGGAIYFYNVGEVTNCNFINNSAYYGGAIRMVLGSVENCNFTNNTATHGQAGAVYMDSASVINCCFTNNIATYNGGAIYFNSNADVTNCSFTNNIASGNGGAVYIGRNATVENCNFTGNNATNGSAIYFFSIPATKTVSNSCLLNNKANAETLEVTKNENNITIIFTGNNNLLNAIQSRNDAEVSFTNVTYWSANGINSTGNSAIKPPRSNREAGQNITLEIFDCDDKLVENVTLVTDINGQAIYDLAKLSRGKFRYNVYHFEDSYYTYAESNGTFTNGLGDFNLLQKEINAAIDSVLTLNRSYTFTVGLDENLADGIVIDKPITINGNGYTINALNKARIFMVTADNVVLNNITFTNANASGEGGAVHFSEYVEGNVTNCSFNNNSAYTGGAIIFNIGSFGRVVNCNFTDNTAGNGGGAVYFRVDNCEVTNCNFADNTAGISSGAIYMLSGSVKNCNFTNNSGGVYGGAIDMISGSVENCNFTNNSAEYGGAIHTDWGSIENCNFTGNNATTGSAIYFWDTSATKTVSNSIFLNNRANAETLEVTKNENNITITFTGNNNLLNAIYSRNDGEVTFTNVTYWSANGINSTGNFPIKPPRSNRQAGQNITLEIFDSDDKLVENVTLVTDINGQAIYDLAKLSKGKYRYNAYHFEDSYYTYAESNGTFTNGQGDFNLLQRYINEAAVNSVLTLNRSYTFTVGLDENLAEGIVIHRGITINGNGYTINALNRAKIFMVSTDNVVLNNITFANANSSRSNGGAVSFPSFGRVINCNFINNTATNGDGGAINMGSGTVTNCNFTNNTATNAVGGAVYFNWDGTVTNCNFVNNSADYGGAISMELGTVSNCNFTANQASVDGGAVYFNWEGTVTNCNFTNNNAEDYGGAVYFDEEGTVTNCNFTGNNATTGSAIYFWSTSATKTVSNSCFLNNRANAETLEVTKNDNNITITFTGNDNLLNAIYSRNDAEVTFSNVTYWSANGIAKTGSSAIKPSRSNKEAGQNITVSILVNDKIVLSEVYLTNENGTIVLDIKAGDNYFIGVRHDTDSYYTEAEKTITNMTFNVNVTSKTTTNKTVNITAKSNIYSEVMPGKLLFILPNGDEVNASYAGNGIWWTKYTFDDYGVYEINASYSGLDNVSVNNGTVTFTKANSTISAGNKTVTYPSDIVLVTSGENSTGINKSSVVIRNPDGTLADANVVVDGFSITISGLGAGNYTVYYNNTVNSDCNGAGNFTGITVLKATSSVSAADVNVTYGDSVVVVVDSKNTTGVSYQIIGSGAVVKEGLVNVGENITDIDLAAGEYTVNLTTLVNANYTASSYKSKITVNPASSYVSAEDVEVTYGEAIVIPVSTVNAVAIYYEVIDENNTVVVFDIIESGLNITVNGLSAGRYNVTYITGVDLNHTSVRNASKITVNPAGSCVSASDVAVNFGEAISIVVSSVNATEISYSILDSNKKSVVNGSVKPGEAISLSDLAAGDYTVSLNTVTDANHTAISNSSKLHIRHVVTVTVEPVTGYAGEVVSFTAEIKYENGELVNEGTAYLTIKYDEREVLAASIYSILSADESVPVSDGKATFNVKIGNSGIYPYVVAYSGEDVDPVQAESTLTILKVNTTVSCSDISGKPTDKKDVTVTVSDHNNKSVENGTVTLTLNGKTYNATVENGKAVLSIELPNPGEYNATVTYNGNEYYNSTTSSIGVNVEKMNTKAPMAGDVTGKAGEKTDITVKFVDEKGNPVKNGTATLTIDGKTYTADVINGAATFKDVVLPEKDTVADVYYQSNDYYNASSATFSVKVKHDSNNSDENKTAKHVSSKAADTRQTGNPIAMMLLALLVMVITYRKK
ncbi:right-handed parallel beta-helix repeat-containing protein [uncultured Methanobrevibacter sp.]|uniref:beta strand repeat-containing protein n=1 Tax=uncultured Methanobrevibacter sp. TaxID=253161 RepID=UPI00262C034A|nr:Ig-like domain repeat protein [uncultured Methanobrevibacter sp.]